MSFHRDMCSFKILLNDLELCVEQNHLKEYRYLIENYSKGSKSEHGGLEPICTTGGPAEPHRQQSTPLVAQLI